MFLVILVFSTWQNSLKVLYKQSVYATHLYDYCNLPNRLSLHLMRTKIISLLQLNYSLFRTSELSKFREFSENLAKFNVINGIQRGSNVKDTEARANKYFF